LHKNQQLTKHSALMQLNKYMYQMLKKLEAKKHRKKMQHYLLACDQWKRVLNRMKRKRKANFFMKWRMIA
jgi:hypothetical protein